MDIITKLGLDKCTKEDLINMINEHALSNAQVKQRFNRFEHMSIKRYALFEMIPYQNRMNNWFGWLYLYKGKGVWGVEGLNIMAGKGGKRFFIDEDFAITCYHANRILIRKFMPETFKATIKEYYDGVINYG